MNSVNKCLSFVVETGKEISKEEKSFGELFCGKSDSKENTKIFSWEVLLEGRRNPALSAADLELLWVVVVVLVHWCSGPKRSDLHSTVCRLVLETVCWK